MNAGQQSLYSKLTVWEQWTSIQHFTVTQDTIDSSVWTLWSLHLCLHTRASIDMTLRNSLWPKSVICSSMVWKTLFAVCHCYVTAGNNFWFILWLLALPPLNRGSSATEARKNNTVQSFFKKKGWKITIAQKVCLVNEFARTDYSSFFKLLNVLLGIKWDAQQPKHRKLCTKRLKMMHHSYGGVPAARVTLQLYFSVQPDDTHSQRREFSAVAVPGWD